MIDLCLTKFPEFWRYLIGIDRTYISYIYIYRYMTISFLYKYNFDLNPHCLRLSTI